MRATAARGSTRASWSCSRASPALSARGCSLRSWAPRAPARRWALGGGAGMPAGSCRSELVGASLSGEGARVKLHRQACARRLAVCMPARLPRAPLPRRRSWMCWRGARRAASSRATSGSTVRHAVLRCCIAASLSTGVCCQIPAHCLTPSLPAFLPPRRTTGHPKEHRTFARVAGYVEQTDIHVPFATVREALQLSARLRLPSHISRDAGVTEAFVHEVRGAGGGCLPGRAWWLVTACAAACARLWRLPTTLLRNRLPASRRLPQPIPPHLPLPRYFPPLPPSRSCT